MTNNTHQSKVQAIKKPKGTRNFMHTNSLLVSQASTTTISKLFSQYCLAETGTRKVMQNYSRFVQQGGGSNPRPSNDQNFLCDSCFYRAPSFGKHLGGMSHYCRLVLLLLPVVERPTEEHDVGLRTVDRVVHPSPTLLHPNRPPLVLAYQSRARQRTTKV